jgi:uncharacterized sulfatase
MKAAMDAPNIIVVLCDDLGYGDLGCYGNEVIATPHLDALAAGGLRCTDFYASAAWCMPSRKGLMTGVHPYRGGMDNPGLLRSRTMLPELLGRRGYASALIGKWHLGMEPGLHPLDQGFDYFYGTRGSNDPITVHGQRQNYETFRTAREESDWPVALLRNRDQIEHPARQSLFTRRYTEEAVRFITDSHSGGKPFFLYLAHNMPHVPLFTAPPFAGNSRGGLYGDVVEELDWSMGEIVRCLEEQGLREDTLILFTSDNGPWCMFREFGGSAGPLRGEKGTGWEGGPRVPAIFSWPGRIAPDVSDAFMVNVDLFATLAAISGAELPSYPLDSLDLSQTLFCGAESPRSSYLFFSSGHYLKPFSYRSGDYKIHVRSNDMLRDPITGEDAPVTEYDPPLLYNLRQEVGERRELSDAHPDVVQRLKVEFDAAAAALGYEATAPYRNRKQEAPPVER